MFFWRWYLFLLSWHLRVESRTQFVTSLKSLVRTINKAYMGQIITFISLLNDKPETWTFQLLLNKRLIISAIKILLFIFCFSISLRKKSVNAVYAACSGKKQLLLSKRKQLCKAYFTVIYKRLLHTELLVYNAKPAACNTQLLFTSSVTWLEVTMQ